MAYLAMQTHPLTLLMCSFLGIGLILLFGMGRDMERGLKMNYPLNQKETTREIGYLNFANYTVNVTGGSSFDNLLNNIWFQPEEVFPIDGTPEQRQHAFGLLLILSTMIYPKKDLKLESCLNSTTCLPHTPKVALVVRGTSASIFLSNAAYRSFLYDKFSISPLDMESASVALICLQQRVPFIAFRALSSGLTGGGSGDPTEAGKFISLASKNSITTVVEFIKELSLYKMPISQ